MGTVAGATSPPSHRARNVGVATGVGVGAVGIATVATIDRIIDVTSHDHRTFTYRLAMKPSLTASKVLLGAGLALAGAGLLAGLNDDTRRYRSTLLAAGAGVGAGLLATIAFRGSWGMLVAPAHASWTPGTRALPHIRPGDIAANAVDRVHMMGRDPDLGNSTWRIFDKVSRLQGHGALVERTGEFAPVLRFRGVHYRTPTPPGVQLI